MTVDNTDTVAAAYTARGSRVQRVDLEDTTLPLARNFQVALDASAMSAPRAAAYHFIGMPFCQTAARNFFAQF